MRGDEVSTAWSTLLKEFSRRPLDLAVRLGGEEFAVVLYDISHTMLKKRLGDLLDDLVGAHIEHKASPTAPYVTVSGGATALLPGDSLDSLFQRADGLLYRAKSEGRNRICYGSE